LITLFDQVKANPSDVVGVDRTFERSGENGDYSAERG
jgi:hypothetical protein